MDLLNVLPLRFCSLLGCCESIATITCLKLRQIREEAELWARAGALGLIRAHLPGGGMPTDSWNSVLRCTGPHLGVL
jgi:hypothetical protein